MDDYIEILNQDTTGFKIANMIYGKSVDDGYRGLHLYYQNILHYQH